MSTAYLMYMNIDFEIILCRYILNKLGMILYFESKCIIQNNNETDMKPTKCKIKTHYALEDPNPVKHETDRIKRILDAKYKKSNLIEIVKNRVYLD